MSIWRMFSGSWCARPARQVELTTHFDVEPPDWWPLVSECRRGDDRRVGREDRCAAGRWARAPRSPHRWG